MTARDASCSGGPRPLPRPGETAGARQGHSSFGESSIDILTNGAHRSIVPLLQKKSMRDNKRDQLQGTLDLLVLRTLSTGGTMHGYSIAERVEQVSRDVLRIEAGSLYPALHRMEEAGWVKSEWDVSDNNRRARFYTITAAGRRRLSEEEEHWNRLAVAVNRVLRSV